MDFIKKNLFLFISPYSCLSYRAFLLDLGLKQKSQKCHKTSGSYLAISTCLMYPEAQWRQKS